MRHGGKCPVYSVLKIFWDVTPCSPVKIYQYFGWRLVNISPTTEYQHPTRWWMYPSQRCENVIFLEYVIGLGLFQFSTKISGQHLRNVYRHSPNFSQILHSEQLRDEKIGLLDVKAVMKSRFSLKNFIFWNKTLWNPLKVDISFGGKSYLHLQGWGVGLSQKK
jgi:hypothetical protein